MKILTKWENDTIYFTSKQDNKVLIKARFIIWQYVVVDSKGVSIM